jgi:hypothetical protein
MFDSPSIRLPNLTKFPTLFTTYAPCPTTSSGHCVRLVRIYDGSPICLQLTPPPHVVKSQPPYFQNTRIQIPTLTPHIHTHSQSHHKPNPNKQTKTRNPSSTRSPPWSGSRTGCASGRWTPRRTDGRSPRRWTSPGAFAFAVVLFCFVWFGLVLWVVVVVVVCECVSV